MRAKPFAAAVLAMAAAGCAGHSFRDAPLGPAGDASRGRTVFAAREGGHCVLCHHAPGLSPHGDVGPSLAGLGSRLSPDEIRFRIVDITRIHPEAVMPAFHRMASLARVAPAYAGRPVLTAAQVEDLVAYLAALK